ncbi:MAG: filamentous hemagglutinin N-terminal domain-containing protein, partial [Comamonadaceae bacterium]
MHSSLNRVFRVIWCKVRLVWVAVSEAVSGHGKVQSATRRADRAVGGGGLAQRENARALWEGDHLRLIPILVIYQRQEARGWDPLSAERVGRSKRTLIVSVIASSGAMAAPPLPTQLPTGAQVVAGKASISQSAATLNVNQSSNRAAIDWAAFNVGSQAQVNFNQPGASSVTLNRVLDANPSQIFGRINAPGQVFLTNPSGVYFAPGASVDVGGLVATTHSISNADFMAGGNSFARNGATGSVVNEGELKAGLGGYIALLAPEVRNKGVIVAQMGTVALAAGEVFELQFDANNTLANLRVSPATMAALVDNGNAVQAPGGLVILSARAADQLQGGVVRNS